MTSSDKDAREYLEHRLINNNMTTLKLDEIVWVAAIQQLGRIADVMENIEIALGLIEQKLGSEKEICA